MAQENTPATPTLEELQAQVEVQGQIIAEQDETIKALTEKVKALEAGSKNTRPTAGSVSAKHGKKDYTVVHGVFARAANNTLRRFSREEVAQNPELLAELIASGSTAVVPA